MSVDEYKVQRDKFEYDEGHGDLYFPCIVCKHRQKTDKQEPCRTCDHNLCAVEDEVLNDKADILK